MKFRVTWYVGRTHWWSDFADEAVADLRIQRLLTTGCSSRSRAGVVTYYPAARLSRITKRAIRA